MSDDMAWVGVLVGEAAAAIKKLRQENDDLHTDLIRVMRERNGRTFALQCFRGHAIRDGEPNAAQNITDWLKGADVELEPQHHLIQNKPKRGDDE